MPSSKKGRKSASGGGSIRKKTVSRNGKEYQYWEARVTVGVDPGTGKQIQKSITAQTQKEVRLKMQELIRKVDEGNYREPCKLTVAQWLVMWTGEYLGALKPLTQDNYKTQCTR
jgi:integrase